MFSCVRCDKSSYCSKEQRNTQQIITLCFGNVVEVDGEWFLILLWRCLCSDKFWEQLSQGYISNTRQLQLKSYMIYLRDVFKTVRGKVRNTYTSCHVCFHAEMHQKESHKILVRNKAWHWTREDSDLQRTAVSRVLQHSWLLGIKCTDSQTVSSPISLHTCWSGRHISNTDERGLETGDWASRSLWTDDGKPLNK